MSMSIQSRIGLGLEKINEQTTAEEAVICPNGCIVTGGSNVLIWSCEEEIETSIKNASPLGSSLNSRYIVCHTSTPLREECGTIIIWDCQTNTPLTLESAHFPPLKCFLADNADLFATQTKSHVQIWQYDGTLLATIDHPTEEQKLTFSGDGSRLGVIERGGGLITLFNQEGDKIDHFTFDPKPENLFLSDNKNLIIVGYYFDNTEMKLGYTSEVSAWNCTDHSTVFTQEIRSPDKQTLQCKGDYLFLSSKEKMKIFSLKNQPPLTLEFPFEQDLEHTNWCVSQDGSTVALLATFADPEQLPSLYFWDASSEKCIAQQNIDIPCQKPFLALKLSSGGEHALIIGKENKTYFAQTVSLTRKQIEQTEKGWCSLQ
ncbi:MAG: hypothetical protein S4CHLAM45_10460 [Chlamydiales bacterium]|nr:hypothetical protein [Chlamydiales bacterium]MCH9619540.1 hypothetical protein [Chlamydiales bacterium]MCH9623146.1 hypothetical protein [Chlamydiales bacterium]